MLRARAQRAAGCRGRAHVIPTTLSTRLQRVTCLTASCTIVRPRRGLLFVRGWLVVTEAKRVSVLAPDGEVRQTIDLPGAGQLWGACKDENRAYVTDIRAGQVRAAGRTWATFSLHLLSSSPALPASLPLLTPVVC